MHFNDLSTVLSWGSNANLSYVIRFFVTMKDEVCPEELDRAVQEAIKRYPYLSIELKLSEDKQHLDVFHNDRPIVVRSDTTPFVLHSEESNYHLHGISYEGKTIHFDLNHGICDGNGYYRFIRTVLYLYITATKGVQLDPTEVWLPGEPVDPQEYTDPFVSLIEDETIEAKPDTYDDETLKIVDPDSVSKNIYYRIAFSGSDFVKVSKKYGSSPAAMFPAYLCRAAFDLHGNPDKLPINCFITADLRKALNVPLSHHNISTPVNLCYTEEHRNWSVGELAKYNRQVAMDFVKSPALLERAKSNALIYQKVSKMRLNIATRSARALYSRYINSSTFLASYVGKRNWGDIEEYIDSVYCLVGMRDNGIMLLVNEMSGRLFVSFCQSFEDDRYVKHFVDLLKKDGIECECSEALPIITPVLDYSKIQ